MIFTFAAAKNARVQGLGWMEWKREIKIKFSFGILEKVPNFATPFATDGFRERKFGIRGNKKWFIEIP